MSSEKSLAIVLRVIEFSETSCVVSMFTRDFGKISALAKGARRPKGPFESAIDLLALIRVVFLHRSTESLDLLTEAKLERRFRSASRDLSHLYAGYYVAELLQHLTDEADPHPELFDAADAALRAFDGPVRRDASPEPVSHFDSGDVARHLAAERSSFRPAARESSGEPPLDLGATVLRFEMAALRELGHLPGFEECVGCGDRLGETVRIAFGQLAGGVLCPRCRAGQRQVVSLSHDAWKTLARFARRTSEGMEDTSLRPANDRREARPNDLQPPIESAATNFGMAGRCDAVGGEVDGKTASDQTWELPEQVRGEVRGVMNHFISGLMGHRPRMHAHLGLLTH